MDTIQQTTLVRTPTVPGIRWGAIFAGVIVGLAIELLLTLLGVAAGLSVVNVNQANAGMPSNAPLWATVWNGVTMLIAAFVGGYVAARMSGLHRKTDGALHGFVAWGATTLLFAALASTAFGTLFAGAFDVGRAAVQSSAAAPGTMALGSQIEALIKGNGGTPGNGQISRDAMNQLQQRIRAGDREGAISLMTSSMGFQPDRAATIVDQALILSGAPERASPAARDSANRTMETASAATWAVFAAAVLSLLLGVFGGLAGALGSRRVPRVRTVTTA